MTGKGPVGTLLNGPEILSALQEIAPRPVQNLAMRSFFVFFHGCFREGCPAKQAPPELLGGCCCFLTEQILLTSWDHMLGA